MSKDTEITWEKKGSSPSISAGNQYTWFKVVFWFDYDLQWCNKLINISVWSLIGLLSRAALWGVYHCLLIRIRIPRSRNSRDRKQLGSVTNWQVNVDHWADRWSGLAAMILTRPCHFCWTSRIPSAATTCCKLPVAYGIKLWDSVVHVKSHAFSTC